MTPAASAPDLEHEDLSAKQELIIRTAYAVMSERGVDRMSLQDVADAAGVSKGIILYHFKTKENLVLTTMRWVLTRVEQRIREAIEDAERPEERIEAMIEAIFVGPELNRRFYLAYVELLDHAARFEPFTELHATFHAIVNGLYAQVVREGVESGVFQVDDVEEAGAVLRALIDGLFLQWLLERDRASVYADYRARTTNAILAYLKPTPAPAT
ncbi:MAG: TetR/AcrR family transcriptional regulator [Nitriliruptorales bacterium]